jgi:hypothetical protein
LCLEERAFFYKQACLMRFIEYLVSRLGMLGFVAHQGCFTLSDSPCTGDVHRCGFKGS